MKVSERHDKFDIRIPSDLLEESHEKSGRLRAYVLGVWQAALAAYDAVEADLLRLNKTPSCGLRTRFYRRRQALQRVQELAEAAGISLTLPADRTQHVRLRGEVRHAAE